MGSAAPAARLAQKQMLARAVALLQSGQDARAAQTLQAILSRWPQQADALHFLGVLRHRQGDSEKGLALVRRAIESLPAEPGPWNNLGNILFALHRFEQAEQAYQECLLRQPDFGEALGNLAATQCRQGRINEAAQLYRRALQVDAGNPILLHHLAACNGELPPARASDAYLSTVFDRDADQFDRHLLSLQYQAPQQLLSCVRQLLPVPQARLAIADLGCGTGLCGVLVRPWAARLVGCDLSAGMLAQARKRAIYDELLQVELVSFLRRNEASFDGLICADTLIYVGDLFDLAAAAAGALRGSGWFAFTVETLADQADAALILQANGRYAHQRRHVDAALAAAGLQIAQCVDFNVRVEAGQAVPAMAVVCLQTDATNR